MQTVNSIFIKYFVYILMENSLMFILKDQSGSIAMGADRGTWHETCYKSLLTVSPPTLQICQQAPIWARKSYILLLS